MARFQGFLPLPGQAAVRQHVDGEMNGTHPPEPEAVKSAGQCDWDEVLTREGDCVSQGEAEINRVILQQLKDDNAPQSEVLTSILDQHLERAADADLWVLCTVSIAGQLGLVRDVVTSQRQEMVHSCIERAQPRRVRLDKERAETFLRDNWGGWDVCPQTRTDDYNPSVLVELAKLCRLGVKKEDAKVRLKEQINKRRVSKTPRVPKGPKLQKADVIHTIALITDELQKPKPQQQPHQSTCKKRRRKEDPADCGPAAKRPALKVVISTKASANTVPASLLHVDLSKLPKATVNADQADIEPEIEVGRGGAKNLSDFGGSSPSPSASFASGCSPEDRHSTAPSSLPITPPHPCKPNIRSPDPRSASPSAESWSSEISSEHPPSQGIFRDPIALDQTYLEIDELSFDLPPIRDNRSRWGLSPIDEEDSLDITEPTCRDHLSEETSMPRGPPPVSTQSLQELKDGRRINASVVNAVLEKMFPTPDVFLVDSSELAKFDPSSRWNAQRVNGKDLAHLSAPSGSRRRRALSAMRLIIPFHHPNKEHWSLFIASRTKETYSIEHYDSVPRKGRDHYRDADQTVLSYIRWLLAETQPGNEIISKDCAAQQDGASCGIHLLANAEAVAENREVPATIDTDAFRRKYLSLLLPDVHEPSISQSSSSKDVPSSFIPSSSTCRQTAYVDTVIEHGNGNETTNDVPAVAIPHPPSAQDSTGHVSADTAMNSSSTVNILTPVRADGVINRSPLDSTVTSASPAVQASGSTRNDTATIAITTKVSSTQPKDHPTLKPFSHKAKLSSLSEAEEPDLESAGERHRQEAKAGLQNWSDRLEAARKELEKLESQASELQGLREDLSVGQREASRKESVWNCNLESLEQVPWESPPKGSSCNDDPSLDDFRAQIRQRAHISREERQDLDQKIDVCDTQRRALDEPIQSATVLVEALERKKKGWHDYVKHLSSFAM